MKLKRYLAILCLNLGYIFAFSSSLYSDPPSKLKFTLDVPVLIYHKIIQEDDTPGQTSISPKKFTEQMKYLHDHGYSAISIDELVNFMNGASLPQKSVVLTFDDAWKSVKEVIPILNQYNFKATFFIVTQSGIGGEYLEWSDIIEIARNPNFEIGSHSMTHPCEANNNFMTWADGSTPGKGLSDVIFELTESKNVLEEKLEIKIRYFAWPCGIYNNALISLAQKAGYEALLTVDEGTNTAGGDIFRIRRIFVHGACDMETFKQLLKNPQNRFC